ncbi:MAG: TIGR03960 family B12-binding radical SAM protein [Proteobacteria bacterium]|nr:TIGR03960 family B12-binding radical SAM protein [Pseudomonadota bacterium]MBU4297393.1 TIGR03960 family B12-binding radical SAM protein [Pseudomonadota bacterium]MCG2748737.1 TIGR03960 family B12-binding radical SAM protein [Desulfobulbaceae bacterium]
MNPDYFLPLVRKAGRYSGNEFNIIKKDWHNADLRVVLCFPDLYEIGMSHQGLQILYQLLNSRADLLAERVYAPDIDLERLLVENDTPLFALESRRPVADFDMLGITLPYELCYSNILTILARSGLTFFASERNEEHPLVIGGGPCAFHAEPIADFFDAILLGDGEEAIFDIADLLIAAKKEKWRRARLLERLTEIEGVYVPAFFRPEYDADGNFAGMTPLKKGYESVLRRVLPSLESDAAFAPLVPLFKIVHDRLGIEIARGCTRGCRFCQAGIIYRPVRERSPQEVMRLAKAGIASSGFEEIALLSLSSGDYACLAPLLTELMDTFVPKKVSVSMPSMRVGTLTPEIMRQIKRVRKTGFTVAPEAGTDRLRRVINKGITEEDLLATCKSAFALGWKLIKFYFMFGLPTETEEDLAAIGELARKAMAQCPGKRANITVSVSTFVPKPHTPFQWEPQLNIEEGFNRIDFLKKNLRDRRIQLRWGDPRQSFLEGVMSRGDRRLSQLIVAAWHNGARLDAWTDHLNVDIWRQAAVSLGMELEHYLRRRAFDEPLPWSHLDVGLDPDFFRQELEKGLAEGYTPDCRTNGCQQCGLCDFKKIRPVVNASRQDSEGEEKGEVPTDEPQPPAHFFYRFAYQRTGRARFISHLELLQLFFRTFSRADLPLNFSQGFNPSPKVSFSPALPLGTESLAEYLVIDTHEPLADPGEWQERLNRQLPEGLAITAIVACDEKNIPEKVENVYLIKIEGEIEREKARAFMASASYPINVVRKKREREIDARPQVASLDFSEDGRLRLSLINEICKAGLKPLEIVSAVFSCTEKELQQARVLKIEERVIR